MYAKFCTGNADVSHISRPKVCIITPAAAAAAAAAAVNGNVQELHEHQSQYSATCAPLV